MENAKVVITKMDKDKEFYSLVQIMNSIRLSLSPSWC